MIYVAEVIEVLEEVPGIRVRFRDLVRSGFALEDFVRVLQPRQHPTGGASGWLPQKGELGAVAEVHGFHYLWLGAIPWLNGHQFDTTPGLAFLRHESGVQVQIRKEGDFEILHPSGFRITVAREAGALPALKATSSPTVGDTTAPVVEIVHPSGASVSIDADGHGLVKGFASLAFQDGEKRFSMEGLFGYVKDTLVSWLKGHTHTSGASGSPTSAPNQASSLANPDAASCLSPDTFLGPQGG